MRTQADKDFFLLHKRYPNAIEAQLAPRDGHPLAQVIDWSDCGLARMYPQWEVTLYESVKNRYRPLVNPPRGDKLLGPDGPSAAKIKSKCTTRYPTDEL
jgi:hypothetical protein